jgi:hypothetical protein
MMRCIRALDAAADVTCREVIVAVLNLAVKRFSTNVLADAAEEHEIEPAKEKHNGANPVEYFTTHRAMSPC